MIIGLVLRNIKTYQGINYIPLTNKENLTALVGNNGVGKSAVLEALDTFFNNKSWNYNISLNKSQLKTTPPYIVPIFFIEKGKISEENKHVAQKLSQVIWEITESDITHHKNRIQFKIFEKQKRFLERDLKKEDYFIIPLGIDYNDNLSISIFNIHKLSREFLESDGAEESKFRDDVLEREFKGLFTEIKNLYQYIYIPKDIDPVSFTKLETREIQSLMGETLSEIIERNVTSHQINTINTNLTSFLEELSNELGDYSFRTTTDRQQKLRKNDVYNLIIEAFFAIRKLHKKQDSKWLDISNLSSGEKQKAIIDLAYNLIKNHRQNTENLIIAVDEPESSLHISACFDHFIRIAEISKNTHQFLFTTHWYGFLPIMEKCSLTSVTRTLEEGHKFDTISLENYREEVRQQTSESRGELPYNLRLKSINDFIQTIISSIVEENSFNWLICEGSSEKIYFNYYFKELVENNKLRIIPVGGAKEIKRIYEHLCVSIEEFKKQLKGKVAFISDTDADLVDYKVNDIENKIINRRIVNEVDQTKLVKIDSNPKSPKTEIEDSLNGKAFYKTLLLFKEENLDLLSFISPEEEKSEVPSYFAMDLKPTDYGKLTNFFDKENIKFDFAKKYVGVLEEDKNFVKPNWILEIERFYKS
ncbi:AAA family ATPase [Capnocytophaga stomatis]|uniref:AAA family ATPase n=1 Tax=Capnocytophaga stomatis TaxID=1848904 RepID=A0ABW8QC07_9FLAO